MFPWNPPTTRRPAARPTKRFPHALLLALLVGAPAAAELVSVSGAVAVRLERVAAGITERTISEAGSFPESPLPVQRALRELNLEAVTAAAVAAQFADPTTFASGNPAEFALSIALNSLEEDVNYVGEATLVETRAIVHNFGELGLAPVGTSARATGRLYLDGAFAVFGDTHVGDLTGAEIVFDVQIEKEQDGQASETVFQGAYRVTGQPNRDVSITATGRMPTSGVFDLNLAGFDARLGVLRVFVFPRIALNYNYTATVGTPFRLKATVTARLTNQPGGAGVVAIVGLPLEAVMQVLEGALDRDGAARVVNAIEAERGAPQGAPAFEPPTPLFPALPLCGVLGLELLAGLALLGGWRGATGWHRGKTRP